MTYNIQENVEYCADFVESFSNLVFYSHIPPAFIALFVGIFVFINASKSLLSRIFLGITIFYAMWSFIDLSLWLNFDNSSALLYAWSFLDFFGVGMFVLALYFSYVYLWKKDAPLSVKVILFGVMAYIISTIIFRNNIDGFDIQECIAAENENYIGITTIIKNILSVWILALPIYNLFSKNRKRPVKEIVVVFIGLLTFLFSFVITEYISSITLDFTIEIYGLFAMLVFIGVLSYSIVTFKTFQVKLIATQALMITIVFLVGSKLFYYNNFIDLIITSITFLLTIIFGYLLIRSVKREIEQKEQLETLYKQLEKANVQQESLMRFINHQVKGFLTRSRNIFDALKSGEYGKLDREARELVEVGFDTNTQAVSMVRSILDAADLRAGTVKYIMTRFDLRALVSDIFNQLKAFAEAKNLKYEIVVDPSKQVYMNGDLIHMAQAIRNLIENSINYTKDGGIKLSLDVDADQIIFKIKDTGIGITPEDRKVLFKEGGRGKHAQEVNVNSTGHGLYITKEIIDAHKGKIEVRSEGQNKGSEFIVSLPLAK